jgi:hypothetical protein
MLSLSPKIIQSVFLLWLALMIPWLVIAPLAGMAFDAGTCWGVDLFLWSLWTYPVSIFVAWAARRVTPWVIFLPIVNVVGLLISNSVTAGGCH